MSKWNNKQLKSRAAERVNAASGDAGKIVLLYIGVSVALSLLVNGLNVLLSQGIDSTGGLSGLSTRSILETAQTVLQYASSIFSPFWQMGFVFAVLHLARGTAAQPGQLLTGFRRAGRVLGYCLLQLSMYCAIGIACSYLATIIFSLTPLSDSLVEILEPIMASGTLDLESLPVDQLISAYLPLFGIMVVIYLPIFIFLNYTLRLTPYFLMDEPGMGAMAAIRSSARAMRGQRFAMFRLDLSFWWYYVVEVCLVIVCYLDMILPLLGVELPMDSNIAFFAALALYGVLELAFQLWLNARVDVTYALAYDDIRSRGDQPPAAM